MVPKQATSPRSVIVGIATFPHSHSKCTMGLWPERWAPGSWSPPPGVSVLPPQRSSPAHIHLLCRLSVGGHDPGGYTENHTVLEHQGLGEFLQGEGQGRGCYSSQGPTPTSPPLLGSAPTPPLAAWKPKVPFCCHLCLPAWIRPAGRW